MDIRFRLGEKDLYRIVNIVLLTGIGLFGAGSYLGIAAPGSLHIVAASAAMLMLAFISYLSARGKVLCLLGATVVVAGLEKSIHFIASYIHWLMNRPSWQEEWVKGYELIQVFWLVLFCYLLQILIDKDFRIKAAGAFMLLAVMVYCLLGQKEQEHTAVAFAICYLVLVMLEGTQRRWNKVKSRSVQAYMLWITPFLAVYFLLFLWIPAPQKPYDWQLFKDVYRQIKQSVLTFSQNMLSGGREDYDLGLSGFSESGSIGGGFLESNREVMVLEGSKGLVTNVYLIGKVYDRFDGNQWEQSVQSENISGERFLDMIETLYAAQRYDKEYLQDYLSRVDLKISYRYFHSGFLFAPLKAWSIQKDGADLYFEDLGGTLLFEEKRGYGTEYEVSFYQMNLDREAFYTFLETETEPDWQLLENILSSFRARTGEILTAEEIRNHKRLIYENYLEDFGLSEETEAYLEQIVRNADTDVEKLRAIEAELSSFTYNRTPGGLPDTVTDAGSFLDYFLLDSREGYCSHFATAFVLLARAEGIPARYVQGYCVPMNAEKEIVVTSNMAHAWPEVYLEDIGWIPFEPTPGYGELRYTPWDTQREERESFVTEAQEPETAGEFMEERKAEEATDGEKSDETAKEQDIPGRFGEFLRIAGMTGLSVVFAGLFLLFVERQIGRWRYRRMNENQRYIVETGKNFRILSELGIDREDSETLEELRVRISKSLSMEGELQFVEDYEKFLYGNQCATRRMIQLAKEEQNRLLQLMKQKKRWRYIYYFVFLK